MIQHDLYLLLTKFSPAVMEVRRASANREKKRKKIAEANFVRCQSHGTLKKRTENGMVLSYPVLGTWIASQSRMATGEVPVKFTQPIFKPNYNFAIQTHSKIILKFQTHFTFKLVYPVSIKPT